MKIKFAVFKITYNIYAVTADLRPICDDETNLPILYDSYPEAETSIQDLPIDATYQVQKLYIKDTL